VVAPVLHAHVHATEAREERERALAAVFHVAFDVERGRDWYAKLVAAVEEAFGDGDTDAPEVEAAHDHHGAARHHHHSHGRGAHGAGSLEHLALAVHIAAAPPSLTPPASVREAPSVEPVATHLTPNYLLPQFSQGPPRC
jgi:hypothetical protein